MVALNQFGMDELQEDDFKKSSGELVPAGEYVAVIDGTEAKQTKDGKGSYLSVTFKIIDDNSNGRLIWENLNLKNANQKAVDIARARYAEICEAIGSHWAKVKDTSELHGVPVLIKVGMQKGKAGYDDQNRIKKVSKVSKKTFDQNAPVASQVGGGDSDTSSAPWEKA